MMKDTELMYFAHIPKSGGTTLTHILDEMLSSKSTFPHKNWNEVLMDDGLARSLKKSPEFLFKYNYVRGHFGHNLSAYTPLKVSEIIMLRKPIERANSHYRHLLRDSKHNNWAPSSFRPSERRLKARSDRALIRFLANFQTRMVSRDIDMVNIYLDMKSGLRDVQSSIYYPYTREFLSRTTFNDLLSAIRHIREYKVVGSTDMLEETVFAIQYDFGLPISIVEVPFMMKFNDELNNKKLFFKVEALSPVLAFDTILYYYSKCLGISSFAQRANTYLGSNYLTVLFMSARFRRNILHRLYAISNTET